MRSALGKLPEFQDLKAQPGYPGNMSFKTPKGFDFRKALDAAIAEGVGPLENYKVLK